MTREVFTLRVTRKLDKAITCFSCGMQLETTSQKLHHIVNIQDRYYLSIFEDGSLILLGIRDWTAGSVKGFNGK